MVHLPFALPLVGVQLCPHLVAREEPFETRYYNAR